MDAPTQSLSPSPPLPSWGLGTCRGRVDEHGCEQQAAQARELPRRQGQPEAGPVSGAHSATLLGCPPSLPLKNDGRVPSRPDTSSF